MATTRLNHTKGVVCEGDVSVVWGSIQEIPHNEKTVMFMQARPGGRRRKPYAIVPGYKTGEYESAGNMTSVQVETISISDQPEVRAKLQSIVEGPINFW